jgi:hypothetical protein
MIKHSARITLFTLLLVPLLLTACGGGSSGGGPSGGGSLQVNITGLPGGMNAAVTVSGPDSYSQKLTTSQTLSGLKPGQYNVKAAFVSVSGPVYAATIKGSPASKGFPVTVSAGQPASVTVSYKKISDVSGGLYISVSGVPAGVTAPTITVTGPHHYEDTLSKTSTLSGLPPGSYKVTASGIPWKDGTLEPTIQDSPVEVVAGATASVTVTYPTSSHGSLKVDIHGLPSGVNANVTVTGPGNYKATLTATNGQTLTGLAPGSYTIEAGDVTVSGDVGEDVYTGTVKGSPVSVQEGATSSASVTYTTTTGDLSVTIGGLPEGTNANVTVSGPGGYNQHLTASATLRGLAPDDYTVNASAVNAGNTTYVPSSTSQPVTISAGHSAPITIAYNSPSASTGSLSVTISGLPQGTDANVTVTGPGSFSRYPTSSQTFPNLAPGSYTVTAEPVTAGDFTYTPDPSTQSVTVRAGHDVGASVTYAPTTGSLEVTISSPNGVTPNVNITGPGFPDPETITEDHTFPDIQPGTYTITPQNVEANHETYSAPSSQVEVEVGKTKQGSVTYTQATGDLPVNITGLPDDTDANVTVTGPDGYSHKVKARTGQTLTNLAPGDYTVTASDVPSGTTTYGGTVNGSPATVPKGGAADPVTVAYAVKGFSISLSPASLEIPFDGSGPPVTVTVTPTGGFTGVVDVSLASPPSGISASPSTLPIAITNGPNSGTLTLSSDNTVTMISKSMPVTVQGTSENGNFSASASPPLSVTVVPEVTSTADSGAGTLRDLVTNVPTSTSSPTTITFDPAVFNADTTIPLGSTLTVGQDLNIQGPTSAAVTLSGNNAVRVMSVSSGVTATVTNLTVANGFSSSSGGGIENEGALTLSMSTISGNSAGSGGGIYNTGTLTLENSTVSNNSAGGIGGGGGIYNESAGALILKNTIVAGNNAGLGGAPDISNSQRNAITSDDYNLIGDGSNSNLTNGDHDQVGTSTSPIDPMLGPLQNNGGPTETMALQTGSPALNYIPVSACTDASGHAITTDQRGEPRPSPTNGNCDIGAYERQPSD